MSMKLIIKVTNYSNAATNVIRRPFEIHLHEAWAIYNYFEKYKKFNLGLNNNKCNSYISIEYEEIKELYTIINEILQAPEKKQKNLLKKRLSNDLYYPTDNNNTYICEYKKRMLDTNKDNFLYLIEYLKFLQEALPELLENYTSYNDSNNTYIDMELSI